MYLVVWIAAVLTFIALVRPLFGRGSGDERTRSITPDSDPLVYAFVQRIAVAVDAPMPTKINVTADVNASAGFRHGLFSSSRNDLTLTLGLSLVAGLNTQQFAGVLAHELGHFTQKSTIRMTMLVLRISRWFSWAADSAYWDYTLSQFGGCLFLIAFPVRLVMKVPQWFFRGLLMLSYLVCGYVFRQGEFDADRFAARVCGSTSFESMSRRIEVLAVAYQRSIDDLQFCHAEGRLGDNLPLLVLSNARQLPEKVHKALRKQVDEGKTRLFDSHPCSRDRIEMAREENSRGIYRVDLPAHLLFANFLGLARNSTWDFYRGIFGSRFQQSEMHPIDDLMERIEREEKAHKTLRCYFQGTFTVLRPIRLQGSSVSEPRNVKETVAALRKAREKVVSIAAAHRDVLKRFDKNDTLVVESTQARELLRAGFRVRKSQFSVPMGTIDQANDVRRQAVMRMNGVCRELVQYEEAHSIRLWSALELMHVDKVANRLGNPEKLQAECRKLVNALALINGKSEDLLQMRNTHAGLQALFTKLHGNLREDLVNELVREIKDVYQRLSRLRESLARVEYPFDHAEGGTTMADYALAAMPEREDIIQIYNAAEQFGLSMTSFYPRLAGRLAVMAEQVETLLGMEPLPEPPEEEEEGDEG
jgi:Zn-dependent protease with chaperone function